MNDYDNAQLRSLVPLNLQIQFVAKSTASPIAITPHLPPVSQALFKFARYQWLQKGQGYNFIMCGRSALEQRWPLIGCTVMASTEGLVRTARTKSAISRCARSINLLWSMPSTSRSILARNFAVLSGCKTRRHILRRMSTNMTNGGFAAILNALPEDLWIIISDYLNEVDVDRLALVDRYTYSLLGNAWLRENCRHRRCPRRIQLLCRLNQDGCQNQRLCSSCIAFHPPPHNA